MQATLAQLPWVLNNVKLSVKMRDKNILMSYANGEMSRSEAMSRMGFEWYGDLLDALAAAKIDRPSLPDNVRAGMVSNAIKTLLDKN